MSKQKATRCTLLTDASMDLLPSQAADRPTHAASNLSIIATPRYHLDGVIMNEFTDSYLERSRISSLSSVRLQIWRID